MKDSDKFFSEHNDLPKHADTVILQVDNNSDKNSLKKNSNSDFESEKLSSSEESKKSRKNFKKEDMSVKLVNRSTKKIFVN